MQFWFSIELFNGRGVISKLPLLWDLLSPSYGVRLYRITGYRVNIRIVILTFLRRAEIAVASLAIIL